MNPTLTGISGIILLMAMVVLRVPLAFAMGMTGMLGIIYLNGPTAGFSQLSTVPYSTTSSFSLGVIPFFILMGEFASYSGLSSELFDVAYKWLGRIPGSLAMATIASCAAFGAVCGSSPATAATIGAIAIPEMKKRNYDMTLATGAAASGGGLGILIPPSVIMIIYGILVQQSISKLFIAGILPGIVLTIIWMATIYYIVWRNPRLGPPGPSQTFKEKILSLKNTWAVMLLFVFVLGGMYMGLFTPTEGGAVGAFGALIVALGRRRMTWKSFRNALLQTGNPTAMIFMIMIGATIFGSFLAITRIPANLSSFITGLNVSRYVVFAAMFVLFMLMSCIMTSLSVIILLIPVFYSSIIGLGFDPIWFGIIVVIGTELGLILPPLGVNVFVVKGIAKDVPITDIFRGCMPFVLSGLIFVVLITVFPQIVTVLPNLMK